MAGLAGRYIPDRIARILDGGCGTGNMAGLLHLICYPNIVGLDASDGMLAAARTKGCSVELHKMLLGVKIAELERSGAWSLVERSDLFRTYPFSSEYASLRHWINALPQGGIGARCRLVNHRR